VKSFTIAAVNVKRLWRDRSNIFFVFILPLGIIIIIGSLFGSGFEPKIGVVGAGSGPLAGDLAERLGDVDGLSASSYDSEEQMLLAVERGNAQAGLVIPAEYDASLRAGVPVEVGFIARPDGAGAQLQATVAAVVSEQSQIIRSATFAAAETGEGFETALARAAAIGESFPEVEVELTAVGDALFPTTLGQFDLGASSQLILFMFLTGLTGSAALIQTRLYGISKRMLSTPTRSSTIILGEAMGRYGVVLIQGLYIIVVTWVAFGVDWGDPLGAAATVLAFGAVCAGFAMLMGAVFRNDEQAGGIGVVAGLGLAALGGSMVPIEIFSPQMRTVAHFTPHAWASDAFAELVRHDGAISDILPELGVLAAFAVSILAFSGWWLRRVTTR